MIEFFDFFIKVSEHYGEGVAWGILIIASLLYLVYLVIKNYSTVLVKYLYEHVAERGKAHSEAASYRKSITPEIRKHLSNLAEETGADRALLFEFSNGNSNLVGLPFLYATATCEVVRPTIPLVSSQYQRVNTALMAEFLEKLEEAGYFYTEDLEAEKKTNMVLYNFMKPASVKSAMFYSLYGVDDTIGFIVLTTTGEKTLCKKDSIPRTAETAQIVSSLLNYDKIHGKNE